MKTTDSNYDYRSASRSAANREASGSAAAQRVEEEEVPQAKFKTAQREEMEELQGKFKTTQREEMEELQGKFKPVQREEMEELQGKFKTTQREEMEELQGKFRSTPIAQRQEAPAPNKTGMPDSLKSGIENLSGMDMSDVRVHYNSSKPAQMNAHAYAQGTDIHVASGQEQHLPHEAWHTVQQKQGRVQPTTEVNGTPVNDSVSLETEADVMGAKAARG